MTKARMCYKAVFQNKSMYIASLQSVSAQLWVPIIACSNHQYCTVIETKHIYHVLSLWWQCLTLPYFMFWHGEQKSDVKNYHWGWSQITWLAKQVWQWHAKEAYYMFKIILHQIKCQTKCEDPFDTTHSGTRTFLARPFREIEATRDCVFCPAHWQRGPTHTVSWAMGQSFCKWHDWNVKLRVSSYICLTTNGKARPQGLYKTLNQKLARSDFAK